MDKSELRRQNLMLLRGKLKELCLVTKPMLARETGLSVVTVNSLMKELVDLGVAAEATDEVSCGGRPAQQFRFCENFKQVLSICCYEKKGQNHLTVTVWNLLGTSVETETILPEKINVELFESLIAKYVKAYPAISCVFLGIPGTESNGILYLCDYEDLKGLPLCKLLKNSCDLPVFMENDVNTMVAGFGACSCGLEETTVGIYFPQNYPPGAGIFLNGMVYKGRNGAAGEIAETFAEDKDSLEHILYVAEFVALFVRTWNPHSIVIYDERLEEGFEKEILKACHTVYHLPEEYLPRLTISAKMYQDYQRGCCVLGLQRLESLGIL